VLDTPAGWYPDPWHKAPLRWWDGALWTPFVSPRAVAPLGTSTSAVRPAAPVLPLRAAWLAIGALVAVQLVGFLGLARLGDGLNVFAAGICLQYGTITTVCLWASHRWGEGRLVHDLGLRFRPADLGWAALAWLLTVVGISRLLLALEALGVPFESNNPFVGDRADDYTFDASRLAVLALVGLVIVVGAPFFEELLFRGVILRGLRSRLPAATAVALQGLVFGAFHFEASRGAGNIGLVIVISGMGIVFGALAERTGRLGSGMIAHAIQNGLVFAVGIATLT
jgi:membrane protease YdiL (CAAX protease family)